MRQIISILILSSLLVYMGGYHLVAALHQYGLKQEMRAYLKTHKDERFGTYLHFQASNGNILDPNFEWEEANEEFRYFGEMYDVVSVKHVQGEIIICALKDTRENDLEKQVAEIRHASGDTQHPTSPQVFKFFSAFCFWSDQEFSHHFIDTSNIYAQYSAVYPQLESAIQTPPPKS